MAETMLVAFGRYLRTLRERRGYSLDDVASLTRMSPDPILKGYLSRCENGKTRIGFSKMNTLCQVYEVPLDVVAERHSLDMELEKIGGPDTKGRDFEDLVMSAATAFKRGRKWDAYCLTRDAVAVATQDPVLASFRDLAEQGACIEMNVATTAAALGRLRFSMHELEQVHHAGHLGPKYHPVVLECMSSRLLAQGNTERARELADLAIKEAEGVDPHPYLGNLYLSRALVASYESNSPLSIDLYQRAYRFFSEAGRIPECANTLMNLAQKYVDTNRLRTARRAIASAERLAKTVAQDGVLARAQILLGEIELLAGKHEKAAIHWREAVSIAKRANDKILHFQAEYKLYEQALHLGNDVLAAALQRRLKRLSPWIPSHVEELQGFRERVAASASISKKKVSSLQRHAPLDRNSQKPRLLM